MEKIVHGIAVVKSGVNRRYASGASRIKVKKMKIYEDHGCGRNVNERF